MLLHSTDVEPTFMRAQNAQFIWACHDIYSILKKCIIIYVSYITIANIATAVHAVYSDSAMLSVDCM